MLPGFSEALLAAVCLPVSSDRILARDLAKAVPVFAAAPPAATLGYAPSPGQRRWFSGSDLERLARRLGLAWPGVNDGVCFEWPTAPLTAGVVQQALHAAAPLARFELLDFSRQPAPAGKVEFPLRGIRTGARGQSGAAYIWRGRVKYAAGRSFPIWAKLTGGEPSRRVVARENLPARKVISAEQLVLEEYLRVPATSAGFAERLEQVVGRVPRRSIEAGKPVETAWLDDAPVVMKGEHVTVEVRTGSMKLSLEAISESGGRKGESVLLRNPSSGKRFRARMEEKGRAVALDPAV